MREASCFVPFAGWLTYESGDAVLAGLREGDYEYLEQAFFHRVLRPGDVFVDCGAHCGLYTRLAAPLVSSKGGAVIAIEPAPETHARLKRNTADLSSGTVSLHQLALGDSNSMLKFVIAGESASPYAHLAARDEDGPGLSVVQLTLPAFLQRIQRSRIDFLKIDCEGKELAILTAAAPLLAQGAIRALMIEFNHDNLERYGDSCNGLVTLLEHHGYQLFALDREQFRLVPARPAEREAYANFFATKEEAWLQQRFAKASDRARRIATEIVRRGNHVSDFKARVRAESQQHIDTVLQQMHQLTQTIRQQDIYIASLAAERDQLRVERTLSESMGPHLQAESQKHIDSLLRQVNQLTDTIAQQNNYIAILEKDQAKPRAESQKHIDSLLQQLNQLTDTIIQQNTYIATLEAERAKPNPVSTHLEPYPKLMKMLDDRQTGAEERGTRKDGPGAVRG